MRRFYQVAIVAVALFSLVAFLIYKHEYDRLKNILQVLNTFGHAPAPPLSSSRDGHELVNSCLQSEGWRQLDDGVHIVTAAFLSQSAAIVVHGIARQTRTTAVVPWTHCNIWMENVIVNPADQKLTSITSEYVPIVKRRQHNQAVDVNMWSEFTLTCGVPRDTATSISPIAVAFVSTAALPSMTPMINVHRAPTKKTMTSSSSPQLVAICGSAIVFDGEGLSSAADESTVVQFIEYHRFVGVNRFVIYTDGLLPSVRRRMQSMSSKFDDLIIEVISWNAPSSASDRSIGVATSVVMRRDCMARLEDSGYKYILFLELNELLVSRYHSRLSNFVDDEANVVDDNLGGLKFDRRVFCTEFEDASNGISQTELFVVRYKNDLTALPPMFTKTKWIAEVGGRNETYLLETSSLKDFAQDGTPILKMGRNFPKVNNDFASIHAYVRCGTQQAKNLIEKANTDDLVINKIRDQFL